MIVSRSIQFAVACVPAAVSIGLMVFFFQNDLALWTLYPTILLGFFPLSVVCSSGCRLLPSGVEEGRRPYASQLLRFFVGTASWFIVSVSAIMISVVGRLSYVYTGAVSAITCFLFAIVFAVVAQMASFQQQQTEVQMKPLFMSGGDTGDETEDNVGELDNEFIAHHRPRYLNSVYTSMEQEIVKTRRQVFSQSSYCLLFASIAAAAAFYSFYAGLPPRFDIYETPTFSLPCINQTTLDRAFAAKKKFDISVSGCLYPFCARSANWPDARFSFEPPDVPLEFRGYARSVGFNDRNPYNATRLAAGCQEYTVLQTCDGLGYTGVVGTIKIGANCTCVGTEGEERNNSHECRKNKDAPENFSFVQVLYYAIVLLAVWQISIFDRNQSQKWRVLRMRLANVFRSEPRNGEEANSEPREEPFNSEIEMTPVVLPSSVGEREPTTLKSV